MDRDSMVGQTRKIGRVLWITFFLNETVALAKLAVGYATGSVGMVSDGFHSIFDGVSNIAGLIGIHIAALPPDREHPYGHRKFESLFTGFVGLMIFGTCFEVVRKALAALSGQGHAQVNTASFLVMATTLTVNILVMRYEARKGRELGSEFLIVDSKHTKSDIFTSSGVLAGLALTKMGFHRADAIAGLVVAVFIARLGLEILKSSAEVLLDTVQVDSDLVCKTVLSVEGVLDCHDIRSRGSSGHIALDLHIQLPAEMSLIKAHEKTHEVKEAILKALPEVCDVVLHTEPFHGGSQPDRVA